jgi:hypothetical protein
MVFAATELQRKEQMELMISKASEPLTLMMPMAPPGAVASAQMVSFIR